MDMREDIFYQFFQELIESYRHDILQREDVKELAQKEIGLWNQISLITTTFVVAE